MPQTIAIDGTLDWYTAEVTLEGVSYLFELAWNTRDSRWYLSLYDAAGVALASSIPIVVDFPLLRRFRGAAFPPGYLLALDTTDQGHEIAEQEDLGGRVQLVYLTEAEVEDLDVATLGDLIFGTPSGP